MDTIKGVTPNKNTNHNTTVIPVTDGRGTTGLVHMKQRELTG